MPLSVTIPYTWYHLAMVDEINAKVTEPILNIDT